MSDLLRNIIKWIIVVCIIILIIFLLAKVANKQSKPKSTLDSGIRTITNNNNTNRNNNNNNNNNNTETSDHVENNTNTNNNANTNQTTVVDSPDTATTAGISLLLGTLILGGNIIYIYKAKKA